MQIGPMGDLPLGSATRSQQIAWAVVEVVAVAAGAVAFYFHGDVQIALVGVCLTAATALRATARITRPRGVPFVGVCLLCCIGILAAALALQSAGFVLSGGMLGFAALGILLGAALVALKHEDFEVDIIDRIEG